MRSPLTDTQVRRYARHVLLPDVGGRGQLRLLGGRVTIAVGPRRHAEVAAIAYLAAAGVGTIALAGDRDGPVDADEIAGGILYAAADAGRPRAEAIAARVTAVNPDVTVVVDGDAADAIALPAAATVADALVSGGEAAVAAIARLLG